MQVSADLGQPRPGAAGTDKVWQTSARGAGPENVRTGAAPAHKEFVATVTTPATTKQAYNFGKQSGFHGHRLSWDEFMRTGTEHPHPASLYRAYGVGFGVGSRERRIASLRRSCATVIGLLGTVITQDLIDQMRTAGQRDAADLWQRELDGVKERARLMRAAAAADGWARS